MPVTDAAKTPTISAGYALAEAGLYGDAIQAFEKEGVGLTSGPRANSILGKCYYLTGQYQKARDHLDQAILEQSTNEEARFLRVSLFRDAGRTSLALRQAMELRDQQSEVHSDLLRMIADLLIGVEEETRTGSAAVEISRKGMFSSLKMKLKQASLERKARRAILNKSTPTELQLYYLQKSGHAGAAARLLKASRRDLDFKGSLSRIMSVREYVEDSGDRFLFQGEPDRISFAEVRDWRDPENGSRTWIEGNAAYVAALRDVTVSARSNFVFGRKGELISDSFAHPQYGRFIDRRGEAAVFLEIGDDVIVTRRPVTRHVDRAIHLCGLAGGHFGHWFSEYLPRLRHFESLPDFASIPILVNDDMPATHFEFLSTVCDNPLIRLGADEEVNVGELLVAPTITFYPFALIPGHEVPYLAQASWSAPAFSYLRERVLSRLKADNREKRAIYLSRRNSTWAKVTNEDALEQALIGLGVEPVMLETMNFAGQVACIRGASLIVSHTGSALNSVVFASPDTQILVFTHAPTHNWGGWLGPLAELGFDPKFHLVTIDELQEKHVSMQFDVDEICSAVRAMREK